MVTRRKKHLLISERDDMTVLDMGEMEIWDGADLALLRETLTELIEGEGCRSIGVDMSYVKYIPSGFFGMLYDWNEQGVAIALFTPQPNVKNMLWFRQFFTDSEDGIHALHSEDVEEYVPQANGQAKPVRQNGTPQPARKEQRTPSFAELARK